MDAIVLVKINNCLAEGEARGLKLLIFTQTIKAITLSDLMYVILDLQKKEILWGIIVNKYCPVETNIIIERVYIYKQTTINTFYPSFRMYFNLLTLLVPTTLIMKRAPVFPYRNFGIRCFQLKQNGVTTWNV